MKNPLAGLLRCGKCGHSIVLRPNASCGMLGCPNRACDNVGSKYDIVEERLLQALASWLADYRLEWSDKLPADEQALIDLKSKSLRKAETELETLRRQLDRTHDLLEQGVYDTDTFLSVPGLSMSGLRQPRLILLPSPPSWWRTKKRAASRRNIVPKVEKLLEVYAELPLRRPRMKCLKRCWKRSPTRSSAAPAGMARLIISSLSSFRSCRPLSGNSKSRPYWAAFF